MSELRRHIMMQQGSIAEPQYLFKNSRYTNAYFKELYGVDLYQVALNNPTMMIACLFRDDDPITLSFDYNHNYLGDIYENGEIVAHLAYGTTFTFTQGSKKRYIVARGNNIVYVEEECEYAIAITNSQRMIGQYNYRPLIKQFGYIDSFVCGSNFIGGGQTYNNLNPEGTVDFSDMTCYSGAMNQIRNLKAITGDLIIPDGYVFIPQLFCSNCSFSGIMEIPSTITNFGFNALQNAGVFTDIYCHIVDIANVSNNWKSPDVPRTARLHVPVGTKAAYQALQPWNQFAEIIEDL